MLKYHPYPANDGKHKYCIITNSGKKVKFGSFDMSYFTLHKDVARKQRYIDRHRKNEDWSKSGVDTPGWWSYKFLWSYPTKEEAYNHIKKDLKK